MINKILSKIKIKEKGFTLVELLVVIIIISILAVSVTRLYNNQTVVENQSEIMNDITMLKYSIGNLPQDINNAVIDNLKDFKQVNSVLVQLGKNGVEKYKYITLDDYKNKLYNNNIFLGFDKVWTDTLDYDKTYTVDGEDIPLLVKLKKDGAKKDKFSSNLTDFWYLKSCITYKNNNVNNPIKFDLENGDKINILLTSGNSFLITDNNKLIDGDKNFVVKKMYCQLVDYMGNEHKIIILF